MTDLNELLERVKKATGPDRELDALLLALAEGRTVRENIHPQFGRQLLARNSRPPHDEYWLDHPAHVSPPVTDSIDAALALVEQVLPGCAVAHIGEDYSTPPKHTIGWTVELEQMDDATFQGQAPTLPLAILEALLSALISKEAQS